MDSPRGLTVTPNSLTMPCLLLDDQPAELEQRSDGEATRRSEIRLRLAPSFRIEDNPNNETPYDKVCDMVDVYWARINARCRIAVRKTTADDLVAAMQMCLALFILLANVGLEQARITTAIVSGLIDEMHPIPAWIIHTSRLRPHIADKLICQLIGAVVALRQTFELEPGAPLLAEPDTMLPVYCALFDCALYLRDLLATNAHGIHHSAHWQFDAHRLAKALQNERWSDVLPLLALQQEMDLELFDILLVALAMMCWDITGVFPETASSAASVADSPTVEIDNPFLSAFDHSPPAIASPSFSTSSSSASIISDWTISSASSFTAPTSLSSSTTSLLAGSGLAAREAQEEPTAQAEDMTGWLLAGLIVEAEETAEGFVKVSIEAVDVEDDSDWDMDFPL